MRAEPGTANATSAGTDPFAPSAAPDGARWWSRIRPPSGRAVVGGLLVALAAAGVLSAHRAASTPPSTRYLVLTADVAAGTTLSADHLGSVALDLPGELAAVQETEAANILGRVAATGLDELDLLRPGDVHEPGRFADPDAVEVALDLPSSRAMLGALERGDRVEVLATDPAAAGTDRVAGATVVDPGDAQRGGIGSASTVTVRLSVVDGDVAAAVVDASVRAEVTLALPAPVEDELER